MKIYAGELTQDHIEAGLAVMTGKFDSSKVMSALSRAGVQNSVSGAKAFSPSCTDAAGLVRQVAKSFHLSPVLFHNAVDLRCGQDGLPLI